MIDKWAIFICLIFRVNLESVKQHVDERTLDMEVIVNPKSLEGVHQGVNVIQLETAVGAAMKVNWKIDLLLPSNQHEFYYTEMKLIMVIKFLNISF